MLFSKKKNRLLQEMADGRAGTDSQISLDRFGVPKSKEILKKKTKLKHTDGDMKELRGLGRQRQAAVLGDSAEVQEKDPWARADQCGRRPNESIRGGEDTFFP